MPLKIIRHTEEALKQDAVKTMSLNIEELLQKMFVLCSKVVDVSNEILECTDFKKIITSATDEEFEEKYMFLQRAMKVFAIMFGSKLSIVDALTKATTTMKNLQLLAQKFDVKLVGNNVANEEPLSNEDIDIMVQMVKDFGEEQIREDAEQMRKQLEKNKQTENDNQIEKIDVYEVFDKNDEKNANIS